ncbi:unnamed protein product [Schistosoma turkestanicum]|nr:unnamed protein product [Schistosoma turkestanicum]
MTDYFNLLPSEISGLVLGFLRDSNCVTAAGAFLRENIHLSEFRCHYATVNEIPLYFRELTLLDIVHDYIHIVNLVIPHLKKANLTWQLGNLTASIAQLLQSLYETYSSNIRSKSLRPIHPVWMPLGKSYIPPRIIPVDKFTPTVRPPLATVKPSVTIASLPNIINSNSTSGLSTTGTLCSLDNNLTSSLRANRPVLRIYRQPLTANKTNAFNSGVCSASSSSSSSSTNSLSTPSPLQTSQSNKVASKSNIDPVQSMVHHYSQSQVKCLPETLPTTTNTTIADHSNANVLSPPATSCNSVILQQSSICTTTTTTSSSPSATATSEIMNPATVQSIDVISQNDNLTSHQLCLTVQSNDHQQEISDNTHHHSIFSVFSLLPPASSPETLVTDMMICPVMMTCQTNMNDVKTPTDNNPVPTRRKRNQPPRQLLSPGSGVASTLFNTTNSYEEELDMERFLSALFNNAEHVATRINAEVGLLSRHPSTSSTSSNVHDHDHNHQLQHQQHQLIAQNILEINSNWCETTATGYEIVSIHPLSDNHNRHKIVDCALDVTGRSQPIIDVYSSSSSSSASSLPSTSSTSTSTLSSSLCTGVKLSTSTSSSSSTSFVCHDFDSDSSDSIQLWNDWFGIKGDLNTCIDHLLSDLESIEVLSNAVTAETITTTNNNNHSTISTVVSPTIPDQNVINNTTTTTTPTPTTTTALMDAAYPSTTVTNPSSYDDIVTSNTTTSHFLSHHHTLLSSPSSSSSSLSNCVTVVSISNPEEAGTTTTTTTTSNSSILSTTLCQDNNTTDNTTNNNHNSESLILANISDEQLLVNTPMISTSMNTMNPTVTHQDIADVDCNQSITSSSSSSLSPFCLSQLVDNHSESFPSKRRCIRCPYDDDDDDNHSSTVNSNNSSLPPILITPDSKKTHHNDQQQHHKDSDAELLCYGNSSASCKLFQGNTNDDYNSRAYHHSTTYHVQPTSHVFSASPCYYSIPPTSTTTQTVISSSSSSSSISSSGNASNTCMTTAYILSNPLSIIDLRQIAQNNNNNNNNHNNSNTTNNNNSNISYHTPLTLYTTNNTHKTLLSTNGNHVNYVNINSSLINMIPVGCYTANLAPFIVTTTTLSTMGMSSNDSMTCSVTFVTSGCTNSTTTTTTASSSSMMMSISCSSTEESTTGVVATVSSADLDNDCVQTIKVNNNNNTSTAYSTTSTTYNHISSSSNNTNIHNKSYSKKSLLIDAKENQPPTPALIIQILNLQSLDIDTIISQSH